MRGCQFYINILMVGLSIFRLNYQKIFLQFLLLSAVLGLNSAFAGREVFVPEESTYFNPSIGVRYKVDMGFVSWSDSTVLSNGECGFVYTGALYRICARMAQAGNYGNSTGTSSCVAGTDQRQGMSGGGAVCGRSQLCAYEDPQDGMDTQTYVSPFHKNEENSGLSITEAAAGVGAAAAASGVLLGPAAAAMTMAYFITGKHNHVVTIDIGCVDVPLATMPPPYIHNIGDAIKSGMLPMVEPVTSNCDSTVDDVGSFEAPRIRVVVRENNRCKEHADLEVGGVCKGLSGFSRRFCAVISENDEMKVCAREESGSRRIAGCVNRPRPPKPVVTRVLDADYKVTLDVSLGSPVQEAKSLPYKDPTSIAASQNSIENCKTLYGIPLCALKKCSEYRVTPEQATINGTASCKETEDRVCLDGFKYGDLVVSEKTSGGKPGKAVDGPPNECRPDVNGVIDCVYYPPVFDNPIDRHYVNPISYRPEVSDLNINPYYVNTDTQEVRAKNAEELGLCVPIPKVYDVGGTYKVPPGCKKISIMAFGGGSAGDFTQGCMYEDSTPAICDFSGGGGGFAQVNFDVSPGDELKVVVGAGGSTKGAVGQRSSVSNNSGVEIVFAEGGNKNLGGGGGGSLTGINVENGQNGSAATCQTVSGGAARPSSKPVSRRYGQPVDVCSRPVDGAAAAEVGAGGCASDDTCANSAWGKGGNGRVIIDCIQ
jgi:hypothetical protein